jgi:hypothetical protein
LPLVVSTGEPDAGKVVGLDATGHIDASLMPVGVGADVRVYHASETLAGGAMVNVYNNSGAFNVRNADASDPLKQANGYVLESVTSNTDATVYFIGENNQVSGLVPGDVYLSTTAPGEVTQTVPSGAGYILQKIGVATSATSFNVEISDPIVMAE